MGSRKKTAKEASFGAKLLSWPILLPVFGTITVVTLLHYLTPHAHHHIHDVLRRVYYIPIVIGAIRLGLRGGLLIAGTVTLLYLPHAFFLVHHLDPARDSEKLLEVLLYFVVGTVAGYLAGKERKQRTRLERSLAEQQRLSEQLVRTGRLSALGETVAGIAHEIKNPLHAMAGTLEIIDPLIPEDSPERKMWEIHRSEVQRLGRVAERFLSFARPSPGTMRNIDLRDVMNRVASLASALARQSDMDLQVRYPKTPLPVLGDTDQLAQIGMNIVLNAQKVLGDRGGTVRISAKKIDHENGAVAAMIFENDGPAIPEDHLEHLFDPFYSGTDSTGLGMSISARIAALHNGHITAKNEGLGVVFTLSLPLTSDF